MPVSLVLSPLRVMEPTPIPRENPAGSGQRLLLASDAMMIFCINFSLGKRLLCGFFVFLLFFIIVIVILNYFFLLFPG